MGLQTTAQPAQPVQLRRFPRNRSRNSPPFWRNHTSTRKKQGVVMNESENRFAWLPEKMPGVAKLLKEKRREVGPEWVKTCWRHGVVELKPGWFFASEGGLSVGALWDDAELFAHLITQHTPTQCVLVLKNPGADDGAN
jgi:hypothetical protein